MVFLLYCGFTGKSEVDVFVTFEGIEGCGKSTQAGRLAGRLAKMGVPVLLTLEPGGTRVGKGIRRILLDARNRNLSPLAELMLYEADRAQHVAEVIRPALAGGKWVVCDRYYDATTAYQGYARGQELAFIGVLNDRASDHTRPDRTFLLDCPSEIGLRRALSRNEAFAEKGQDRFEKESMAFHEAVRRGYLTLADAEPDRFVVVDGTLDEDRLEDLILGHVMPFLRGKGR
jgi:dTMP kinase